MTPSALSVSLLALSVGLAGLLVAGAIRYAERGRSVALFAAGIALWLAVVIVLTDDGFFVSTRFKYFPAIAVFIVAPVVAGWALFGRSPSFRAVIGRIPLPALVAVQLYRVAGAVFLVGLHHGDLPRLFAWPAGIGDIAVGLAAPFVAYAMVKATPRSEAIALVWCLAGIADLVLAVTLGFLTSPSPFQQLAHGQTNLVTHYPYALVPAFAVPISVVLHLFVVARLRLSGTAENHVGRAAEPALAYQ
jgi:hypothetical protein